MFIKFDPTRTGQISNTESKPAGSSQCDKDAFTQLVSQKKAGLPKHAATTQAMNEHGGNVHPPVTSASLGEEGGGRKSPTKQPATEGKDLQKKTDVTSMALGEEGGGKNPPHATPAPNNGRDQHPEMTSMALGEEGGGNRLVSTQALGEEGGGV